MTTKTTPANTSILNDRKIQNSSELLSNTYFETLNANGVEKEINIHEFLDFLNTCCHLNDMIDINNNGVCSVSNNNQCQNLPNKSSRRPLLPNQTYRDHQYIITSSSSINSTAQYRSQLEIDFKKLSENRLINHLYGLDKNKQQRQHGLEEQHSTSNEIDKIKPKSRRSSSLLEDCLGRPFLKQHNKLWAYTQNLMRN